MALPAPAEVQRVALLGTGTIGASWAAHFLSRGLEVIAWDPAAGAEAKARDLIERAWPAIEALGMPAAADPDLVRRSGRGIAYTRSAFAYLFRKCGGLDEPG